MPEDNLHLEFVSMPSIRFCGRVLKNRISSTITHVQFNGSLFSTGYEPMYDKAGHLSGGGPYQSSCENFSKSESRKQLFWLFFILFSIFTTVYP
jgi:hypothetical protein